MYYVWQSGLLCEIIGLEVNIDLGQINYMPSWIFIILIVRWWERCIVSSRDWKETQLLKTISFLSKSVIDSARYSAGV